MTDISERKPDFLKEIIKNIPYDRCLRKSKTSRRLQK